MSGIEREREGGHISLRTEGQGDASGWGGWDAPLRLANSLGEKSPTGPTEDVACSGMETQRGTILHKRKETHYWETREGVN